MHTFIPMYCTILYETMLYVCRRIRKVFVAQWKAQKTAEGVFLESNTVQCTRTISLASVQQRLI